VEAVLDFIALLAVGADLTGDVEKSKTDKSDGVSLTVGL